MNPAIKVVVVIAFVLLIAVQQYFFERNLRRAEQNHSGLFGLPPTQRRIAAVVIGIVGIVVITLSWQHTR